MKPIDSNSPDQFSSPGGDEKSHASISDDERDFADATALISDGNLIAPSMAIEIEFDNKENSFARATTAVLIKENNQVLCPLSRKTRSLHKYCVSYAQLTFLDDQTPESFRTARSTSNGDCQSICTCCAQCKVCRRDSDTRRFVDVATQTIDFSTNVVSVKSESIAANSGFGSVAEQPTSNRIVCTYMAESIDEFYPARADQTRVDSKPDESNREAIAAIRPRIGFPRRKLRSKKLDSLETTDLFLNYVKLLILRRKEKFSDEFWSTHVSAFNPLPSMTSDEVESCRRRFGDGYDAQQLERMLPLAIRSATPTWRHEMLKSMNAQPTQIKDKPIQSIAATPTDQYVRIDRIDQIRSVKEKELYKTKLGACSKPRCQSNWTTPVGAPSLAIPTAPSPTPRKLNPIKSNRAYLLRTDAIYAKYSKM